MADQEKAWQPLELVKVSAEYLAAKDVPNPRLDAEVLLVTILGLRRRVDLYAGFERSITEKELVDYREMIRRRAAREPVSHILGRREFMGIDFVVTPDVLSPRPETELLVEEILSILAPKRADEFVPDDTGEVARETDSEELSVDAVPEDELARLLDSYAEDIDDEADIDRDEPAPERPSAGKQPTKATPSRPPVPATAGRKGPPTRDGAPIRKVLDLGTGSGCIAVSVAAKLPNARVLAVDASQRAIAVARKNAESAGVSARIAFRQGDWLSACKTGEHFDVIVSNPPYLIEGDPEIWPEVSRYDPAGALYGGPDGLDCYRRILPDAGDFLNPGGWILFEVGAGQAGPVGELMKRFGFTDISTTRDYGGIERVVKGRRAE